ncbi:hypothetical protein V2H45_00695 [Tumidithrix elongata RA019]|uniref:Uncharacterized protein n=1 Tax=Tumidithrix elongata BACA0141 TaxID=2716417 RepID=A0AAW9PST8_9CYAN|nr:hypothetical protein [Tumidithrix elongata RA019]
MISNQPILMFDAIVVALTDLALGLFRQPQHKPNIALNLRLPKSKKQCPKKL